MTEMCACGKPLHYSDPKMEALVRKMIKIAGGDEYVLCRSSAGAWRVQRHYIALHGLKAWELPAMAAKFGFERVDN